MGSLVFFYLYYAVADGFNSTGRFFSFSACSVQVGRLDEVI